MHAKTIKTLIRSSSFSSLILLLILTYQPLQADFWDDAKHELTHYGQEVWREIKNEVKRTGEEFVGNTRAELNRRADAARAYGEQQIHTATARAQQITQETAKYAAEQAKRLAAQKAQALQAKAQGLA